MIPLAGGAVTAAKLARKGEKAIDVAKVAGKAFDVVKDGENALDMTKAFGENADEIAKEAHTPSLIMDLQLFAHKKVDKIDDITKVAGNPIRIDEYGILKNDKTVSGQAHHLNQNAAYRDVVPSEKGISIKLEGNAFTQPGTPHYNAHESMEGFWNQFRRGGDRYGEIPTNLEYLKAVFDSMQNSGFTRQEALDITRQSIKQRLEYGLLGGEPVPRIPGRINQVK